MPEQNISTKATYNPFVIHFRKYVQEFKISVSVSPDRIGFEHFYKIFHLHPPREGIPVMFHKLLKNCVKILQNSLRNWLRTLIFEEDKVEYLYNAAKSMAWAQNALTQC